MVDKLAFGDTGNPALNTLFTVQTLAQIVREYNEIRNVFDNFKWILISIFLGVIISILVSFGVLFKIIGIILFFCSSLVGLYIFLRRRARYIKRKNALEKHERGIMKELYLTEKINDEELIDFVKNHKTSQSWYNYMLAEKKRLETLRDQKIEAQSKQLVQQPIKLKITFSNGVEEVHERVIVSPDFKQMQCFDEKGNVISIIPFSNNILKIEPQY